MQGTKKKKRRRRRRKKTQNTIDMHMYDVHN